jgi:hypothetical protein
MVVNLGVFAVHQRCFTDWKLQREKYWRKKRVFIPKKECPKQDGGTWGDLPCLGDTSDNGCKEEQNSSRAKSVSIPKRVRPEQPNNNDWNNMNKLFTSFEFNTQGSLSSILD